MYHSTDEKTYKEKNAWNAKVESEDEHTQMILLTWVQYDQYIQQTMLISAMCNHQIDANLIYSILINSQGKIDQIIAYLPIQTILKKYNNKKKKFVEKRCCNHQINLLCIFVTEKKFLCGTPIELAALVTVNSGLPFVKKDLNKICKFTLQKLS
ncbi:hypothetical protein RFI_26707 [Reticulomyxa filosa]|uniref:Uncharacterized protein n=1 Tax=Reticulomyxa filosa TaxID=46433 RepID=X6MCA3_RETFI|nr:hypothetical protein RFI_26707 [Reticulomyxa filosa]|eukprot:ETO10670.1 hypothetical protein RFI_26707 [Reticulomyxa filosa]